ncbi:MAG: RDD family protein [Flavobacteriales bacterium]|nr:RDD family protein [Flavobacteriales bacterium]
MNQENQMRYAGFWVRVGASLIDFLVLLIPLCIHLFNLYSWKLLPIELFIYFLMIIYKPFMEMRYGATLGKMAVNLKVVTPNEGLMNFKQTLIRNSPWLFTGLVSTYSIIVLFTHPLYAETNGFIEIGKLQQEVTPLLIHWVSSAFFFIAVIIVAFHPEKRGLHDLLAGTYCIKDTGNQE